MTTQIIQEIEDFVKGLREKWTPEAKEVENEVKDVVTDAVSYIKVNGLQDLEQIALTLVSAMVPGASWVGVLAGIKAQAVTDGVKLLDGAEGIVAAKVQSDLLAIGKPAGLPATA